MSQFLNTDKISLSYLNPIDSWKGKTFTQITSSIKKNNTNSVGRSITKTVYKKGVLVGTISVNPRFFLPNPLKIYRREIANPIDMTNCYPRSSLRIDEFDRPNGSIINTSSTNQNGLVNTVDNNLPNNKCEKPGTCSIFLSPSENAKRRCRSSGIIKQNYNPSNNSASYYTNANQYLISRNKTFQQNQYYYIRVGDPLLKPGPGLAASNIYTANGLPVCAKHYIPEDCGFDYQWVDGQYYSVNVPKGYYSIDEFKNVFQVAMSQNYHFLFEVKTGSKVFLINIIYDDSVSKFTIQFTPYDSTNFPSSEYVSDVRANQSWTHSPYGTAIIPPTKGPRSSLVPGIRFTNNEILPALGITSSSFPIIFPQVAISNDPLNNTQTYVTRQALISNKTPGLHPIYKKIYYKPNNSQFAQQGAVSSSSLIARIKYDTVNKVASSASPNIYDDHITNIYGSNFANALSYGVSENPYTMKDKIGYPNIKYPSFPSNSSGQKICTDTHIAGGVKYNS